MYIIGIDIGKNHHEASIVDYSGKLIGRSCHFSNTHKGADKLMEHITRNIGNSHVTFGMEATGHYWYAIYSLIVICTPFRVWVSLPLQQYWVK